MKLTQQLSMTEREKTKATELWNIEGPKLACGHLLVYLRGDLGAQEARPCDRQRLQHCSWISSPVIFAATMHLALASMKPEPAKPLDGF